MGEYLVLSGGPALVLCHPPEFQAAPGLSAFHPDSAAGRLLAGKEASFRMKDPHGGKGGFGASGAEYCFASFSTRPALDPWTRWEEYRRMGTGSGVDVLAQCLSQGKPGHWWIHPEAREANLLSFSKSSESEEIRIFHTGRKLKTHELQASAVSRQPLESLVREARQAFLGGTCRDLAVAINGYHDAMLQLGLMCDHSDSVVKEARGIDGVLAAKGCGAMGSDVVLVLCRRDTNLSPWEKTFSLWAVHRERL